MDTLKRKMKDDEYRIDRVVKAAQGTDNKAASDQLAAAQNELQKLKLDISFLSKTNYSFEKDIRTLDQKIALLIRNRITLEDVLSSSGDVLDAYKRTNEGTISSKKDSELYGTLFYILQRNTRYLAKLTRQITLAEIDTLLQTVMFTLYGNQYEPSEEHLLLTLFREVLETEFELATDLGSLLRANTAITRMMTTYTRRGPGQMYLKSTLTSVLAKITEDKSLVLEINPAKVYDEWVKTQNDATLADKVDADTAAAVPQVQEIIRPRIEKLKEVANMIADAIIASLDQVPYGIRWICKQIKDLVRQKFPNATQEQLCSLIGGFFLLRFVNPAIVTPQAFMLVEAKLSVGTRRNLTLLAKVMQNLSNNTRFGGVKEKFMEPLNAILDRQGPRLNKFLNDLTRCETLEERLSMDHYLTMAKRDDSMVLRITLNELRSCHALLQKHRDKVCTAGADDPLISILDQLGEAPEQLPRAENLQVQLKLISALDEEPSASPEHLYSETKYMFFQLLRRLGDASNLNTVADVLSTAEQRGVADTVSAIRANLASLNSSGTVDARDDYARLRQDIVLETRNYHAQIEKTQKDVERLKAVLHDVREHRVFLEEQYEAYKQYLSNVRAQSGAQVPVSKKSDRKKDRKTMAPAAVSGVAADDAASARKGPFRFPHAQLIKDGVVLESAVPEERQAHIIFSFESAEPGIYDVAVLYKSRSISEIRIALDELLELQAKNESKYVTDFLTFDVALLLFLLNKTFLS